MKHALALVVLLAALPCARGQVDPAGPAAPAAAVLKPDDLIGLWKAQRWFGPAARGPLIIQRSPAGWSADFLGRVIAVHADRTNLALALPDGAGAFDGQLPRGGGAIVGHWTTPASVINGNKYAVPLVLAPDGRDRWLGMVVPRDDNCAFYLLARKRPDGVIGAWLRNPERNLGTYYNIDRLECVGNVVNLVGREGGSRPESVVLHGVFDPESKVLSIDISNRGGTYDFRLDDDPESGFYPRGREPARYAAHPPLARNDDWPTGTIKNANIDRAGLERFFQMIISMPMESVHTPVIEAVLVARHGKLVAEEYFHGFSRDTLHETRSAAKSVTATIVGAAIQAGAPLRLSSPVYEVMNGGTFPPGLEPRKRAMTLEHLLMMRSGFFCDDSNPSAPGNEDAMEEQTNEPDYYKFTLNVPLAFAPDEQSVYCSCNPNLALGMAARAAGESPLNLFDRLIARPLNIKSYAWPLDPAGHPYGGGGVLVLPRDFLKLGQLMLDGGVSRGRRILGREFVARASAPLHDLRGIQYGYLWWSLNYPYKNRTIRAYFAGGNGGQTIMVIPELDLVIALFAGNYADRIALYIQQDLVPNYILPAVREAGDDPQSPVVEHDFHTPYGRPPVAAPDLRPK